MPEDPRHRQQAAREYWDQAAATYDEAPDHGLREASIREAWTELLRTWLPRPPATVLDAGCGTGSLSIVLAGLGYAVTGIDLSPGMISLAEAKMREAGQSITFYVMDAAAPVLPGRRFAAIVCRHLLWALPETRQVLARWTRLLRPGGRLLLVEGFWHTGGLHAPEVIAALPKALSGVALEDLSGRAELWGSAVADERYLIAADS